MEDLSLRDFQQLHSSAHETKLSSVNQRRHVTYGPAPAILAGRVGTPELHVGKQEECGSDQQQSQLVAPQIPRRRVCDALLRQKLFARSTANIRTPSSIKRGTLFQIISLAFLGGFLHFLFRWKHERILYG